MRVVLCECIFVHIVCVLPLPCAEIQKYLRGCHMHRAVCEYLCVHASARMPTCPRAALCMHVWPSLAGRLYAYNGTPCCVHASAYILYPRRMRMCAFIHSCTRAAQAGQVYVLRARVDCCGAGWVGHSCRRHGGYRIGLWAAGEVPGPTSARAHTHTDKHVHICTHNENTKSHFLGSRIVDCQLHGDLRNVVSAS